jgi:hypothetical protein
VSAILPDAAEFETPVYGTIFAGRATAVARLLPGQTLILVPDPADTTGSATGADAPPAVRVAVAPKVWVHAAGGDVLGHLSPDINSWLAPRMMEGARYAATVVHVGDPARESWRRLVITIRRIG